MGAIQDVLVCGFPGPDGLRMLRLPPAPGVDAPTPSLTPTTVMLDRAFSLAAHPGGRIVYAVALDDTDGGGEVTVLGRVDDAGLELLDRQSALGATGLCRVRVSNDASRLLIAGYTSGTLTTVPLDPNGMLAGAATTISFSGSGPDPERQAHPFAHDALDLDGVVLVADLGADLVRRVAAGPEGLRELEPIPCPPGSGPRHLATPAPGYVVATGELDSTVILMRVGSDGGEVLDAIPATMAAVLDRNFPSSVVADAARPRIHVANRGADSITSAEVVGDRLVRIAERPSGGNRPEHLILAGDRLVVAHSGDGIVTALPLVDGLPGDPAAIARVPGAVWVEPMPSVHASKPATAR